MSRFWPRLLYRFLPPVVVLLNIVGHRHRHAGNRYLRPVPDRVPLFWHWIGSGIGIFLHSGTGLTGCRAFRHLKNTLQRCKGIHTLCTFIIASDGLGYTPHVHTASCGKGYTLHVHTYGGGKGYTLHVHIFGGGKGYTLHVHTAGGGKGYTHRCLWWCYSCNMMLKNHR